MSALVEFVTARLDEDEAVAERAASHPADWGAMANDNYGHLLVQSERVLATVAAHRRIVQRDTEVLRQMWRREQDEHRLTFDEWLIKWPPATLCDLASIYADHPDFDEQWRT